MTLDFKYDWYIVCNLLITMLITQNKREVHHTQSTEIDNKTRNNTGRNNEQINQSNTAKNKRPREIIVLSDTDEDQAGQEQKRRDEIKVTCTKRRKLEVREVDEENNIEVKESEEVVVVAKTKNSNDGASIGARVGSLRTKRGSVSRDKKG